MECTEHASNSVLSLPGAGAPLDPDLSPEAAAVRAALLNGLATVPAFAEGVDKCKRTVDDWIARGMPTVYVGRTPYIPISEARAWLLKPSTRNASARKVGRPRKIA